jgi:predicted metal-dependent hydrolase
MSKKSARIAELIRGCEGKDLSPNYLGYFELFNQGLYYESHDVLEALWLPLRKEGEGDFYKGLIQLAGAFVHLQKGRLGPAGALFRLARANLGRYGPVCHRLEVGQVTGLIEEWLDELEAGGYEVNPLREGRGPRLMLLAGAG